MRTRAHTANVPVRDRMSLGEVVRRSGNDQSTAFGDRSAQQLEQRVSDARIGDAIGSQKKPHDPSRQSDRVSGGVPENIAEVILSSLGLRRVASSLARQRLRNSELQIGGRT